MKLSKKYLTIKEKKQLVLEGKDVPICVYENDKTEKRRKKQQRKLANKFLKNVFLLWRNKDDYFWIRERIRSNL